MAKTESGEEEESAAASAPPSEQWPTFSPEGGKKACAADSENLRGGREWSEGER